MPSWPSRFLSGTSNSNNRSPASAATRCDDTPPHRQFLEAAVEGDSFGFAPSRRQRTFSGASSSSTSPVQRPSGHGRSISHPFPSLFGGGKKAEMKAVVMAEGGRNATGIDLDPSDKEVSKTVHGPGRSILGTPSKRRIAQQSDTDLVTGRCATCDSMVRWPGHLDVYRCSTCLMINDLKFAVTTSGSIQTETPPFGMGTPFTDRTGT